MSVQILEERSVALENDSMDTRGTLRDVLSRLSVACERVRRTGVQPWSHEDCDEIMKEVSNL